ncbi:FUSC family membrane protein [Maribacter confluentis]|uniref:FUSC family membrane protein n=1 Tax=Maribacter confluentis TaxID=1656093 RepID=A0ABT8RMU0_9FLAO|nr:FUSC family membrane protein [Maribacter confluentis]MDO1512199.1 FUSC family membrane protein [Maribacter confluentis]
MKEKLTQLELFFKSSSFDRGLRLGVGIIVPFAILYAVGYFEYAPAIVVGVLLNAPSDIPGSATRRINAILISILLTMLVTLLVLFAKPIFFIVVLVIAVVSFMVSLIAVYGFRASLLSFSGLLSMVLAFAIQKETPLEIFIQVGLMGVGGLWYLAVSLIFQKLAPDKDQNQLLSDTLQALGTYLRLRTQLWAGNDQQDELLRESFFLQNQINDKQETLREILLTQRKRSGLSPYEEKQLLMLRASVNIFELIEAMHINNKVVHSIHAEHRNYLLPFKEVNNILGNHLIHLAELLIQKDKIPNKHVLLNALEKANETIASYIAEIGLPAAREGALTLKTIFDYQERLVAEIRVVRRIMANVKNTPDLSLKKKDSAYFLTNQEFGLKVLTQNLSFKSTLFRHAFRFSIALLFAYLLGYFLDIQNTYWILLTIVVIMRPSYGLTKTRSTDRIIGTLIGALFAIGVVLLTQNTIVYAVLAFVSLILAFSLIQRNYKFAAALITISIVFVYSLINPNAFEVIQYRVIDTVLGAIIAVVANYTIFPSWEADNFKQVLLNAFKTNNGYLLAMQKFYKDTATYKLAYNVARKEAFLAIGNLNASFQRLTQDPKSKQKNFQLLYEMVTLNQAILSAIAGIGNFVVNHKTTPASAELQRLFHRISSTLGIAYEILEQGSASKNVPTEALMDAEEKLLNKYVQLSNRRDEEISLGKTTMDTDTLHGLQEAYLISNHIIWLKSLSENLQKTTEHYVKTSVQE